MKNFIFIILGLLLFSSALFASFSTAPDITSDQVFYVTMKLPNPYYGLIVADRIATTNSPTLGQYLRVGQNGFEWAHVSSGGGEGGSLSSDDVTWPLVIDNLGKLRITDSGITAYHIGDGQVAYWNLGQNSVRGYHLASDNFAPNKFLKSSASGVSGLNWSDISGEDLLDETITSQKLAVNSVTSSKIADNAINTSKILDLAVTKEKIAIKSIDHTKLDVWTPSGYCPSNNANLIYNKINNRLEWSQTTTDCDPVSFSSGSLNTNRTYTYFSAPFNQCIQNVTHTENHVTCIGGGYCVEQWTLSRSGGSNTYTNNINSIPSNSNRTKNFVVSQENGYKSSYTLKYSLTQSETGLYGEKLNSYDSIPTTGCQPQVGTLGEDVIYQAPNDQCVIGYNLKSTGNNCIGTCEYEVILNNNTISTGTLTGNNKNINVYVPYGNLNPGQNNSFIVKIKYPNNSIFPPLTQQKSRTFFVQNLDPNLCPL